MNQIFTVMAMLLLVLLTAKAAWGAVVINEVMPNPNAVDDTLGEYFELYNTDKENNVNIDGWTIKDEGSNTHKINNGGELILLPEKYLLLCRNKDINVNGGLKCDYQYSNFSLANSNDAIIILDDTGVEQDNVKYTTATAFNFGDGVSMELKDPSLGNDVADNWKKATSTYGAGDKGTPGKSNNDVPKFTTFPENEIAVEGIEWEFTINAEDLDKDKLVFSIDLLNAPAGMELEKIDDYSAKITYKTSALGEYKDITVKVTDGIKEVEKSFNLTVKPYLDVTNITLKKEGKEFVVIENKKVEGIALKPGNKFTIQATVKNNGDEEITNVKVDLYEENKQFSFKCSPETAVCPYVINSIKPGEEVLITFEREVPNFNGNGGEYTLYLKAWSNKFVFFGKEDLFDFSIDIGKFISDFSYKINFENNKTKTYCDQWLKMNVDVENLGIQKLDVYIDVKTGDKKLTSNKVSIDPSNSEPISLEFNTSELNIGENKLDVVLEIVGADGDKDFVNTSTTITKNKCFIPEDPVLELFEGEAGKVVNLTKYLNPEISSGEKENIVFSIDKQSNPELVDCRPTQNAGEIECTPKNDVSGASTIDINIKSKNALDADKFTDNKGQIKVKVLETIKVVEVKVKGVAVADGETSTGIKPEEEFDIEVTVKNNWKSTIKDLTINFVDNDKSGIQLKGDTFENILLTPSNSQTFTTKQKLPGNVDTKASHFTVKVDATDVNWKEVNDSAFDFNLNIGKETGELKITKLEFEKKDGKEVNETYCNPQLKLMASYINSGKSVIDDISVSVKENGNPVTDDQSLTGIQLLNGSQGDMHPISINTTEMSVGEHTISVTFTYTYDGKEKSDSETIKLTKHGCLNISVSELTEENTGLEIDLIKLLVGKEDKDKMTDTDKTNDFTFTVTKQSNETLIICGDQNLNKKGQVYGGILHCDWPFGADPTKNENVVASSLNDGENLFSEIELTINKEKADENKETFTITVTGKNDAPEFKNVPLQVTFSEDTTASIKISDWVKDVDNELSELSFSTEGNKKVMVLKDGEKLVFSAEKDWHGSEEFELTVTDPAGLSDTKKIIVKVTEDLTDDTDWNTGGTPISDVDTIGPVLKNELVPITKFKDAELCPGTDISEADWYDSTKGKTIPQKATPGKCFTYPFNANGKVGEFEVELTLKDKKGNVVVDDTGNIKTWTWIITTTDKPLDLAQFGVDETSITNINSVKDLTLKNSYGEIKFKNAVDLSSVAKLADVVKLEDKLAAIDSSKAAGINQPATITLYNTGLTNPVIKKTAKFTSDKSQATEITTIKPTISGGTVTFDVNSFSTYVVVENVPAAIEISAINFDSVNWNTTVNTTFTIKNSGSLNPLTNLKVEFVGVDSKYNIQPNPIVLSSTTLDPQQSIPVILTLTIPTGESSGSHSIGSVKVSSTEDTETAPINLNPKSALTIESVEVNGKKNGELSLEKENEFEVEVKNDYTEDMEDVTVTVTILDVDGDDIDEESDSFDLDEGDDDTVKVKIDLSTENVDEDEYTVEILVEGDADDDSTHETLTTVKVKVDRQKHKVLLNEVTSSSTILECNRQTSLEVELKNIGKSDEDDVQVKVKNTALGMELIRDNIKLDDYSGSDNTYDASFNLNLEGAAAGTYPVIVELYLDGKLEETDSVNVEVKECLTTSTATQPQPSYSTEDVAKQMQEQLQQQLLAKKQAEQAQAVTQTTTKVAFRDTPEYTLMLGALVILGFIAIILAFAVLMKGGKRKVE